MNASPETDPTFVPLADLLRAGPTVARSPLVATSTSAPAWSGGSTLTDVDDSLPGEGAARSLPVRLFTLGCKVNQYETQFVRETLLANGYREAVPNEPAALAVVNTCTVTAEADSKGRGLIRRIARDNPGVKIVVMGCYATRDPAAVRRLPGVAAVIEDKRRLEDALEPFGVRRRIRGIRRFDDHRRAFVKVQDGCILDCSFCIIPKVRPGLLSRQPDDVLDEVRHLTEAGYREIVLTGIHLGHYGVDFGVGRPRSEHFRLWHLLERLAELPGEFRIRLSSLEATEVTDDFVRVFARLNGRVCPFLHLSMQSGSDPVLVRMKRRYRIARFLRRCDQIRNALDEPALATDVIVGFPGETEADFARTLAACRSAGFSKIHIFPFSARRDTEAAGYRDAVAPEVIAERKARLADLERELARDYHRRLLGRRLEMLVQTPDPDRSGWMTGTACRYAPLRLETVPALSGRLVPVRARRLIEAGIEVEPIPDEANGVADMEVRA